MTVSLKNFSKNSKVEISILIINWNSMDYLTQCLRALSEQTYRNFEVIVGDNKSEKTLSIDDLRCFCLPKIRLLLFDQNHGFAKANNLILNESVQSKWLIFLNPDAFPEPDWLEQLVSASNRYPEFTSFGSFLVMANDDAIIDGRGDKYHVSGFAWRSGHGKKMKGEYLSSQPKEIFTACAAASMHRTDLIRRVGGFDPDFFCYFEDVDLGFRLRLLGNRCLLVPRARVKHVGSATSGGKYSNFAVYHGQRNLVWTFIKNMPGFLLWLFLPHHVALNLFCILLFSMKGRSKIILKAKKDALIGLPDILSKRNTVQENRVAGITDIFRMIDKSLIPKFFD